MTPLPLVSTALAALTPVTSVSSVMETIDARLYDWLIIYLLIGAGLYFTLRSRMVQVRFLPAMFRTLAGSNDKSEGGVSSFQAFAIGLASRVGTGNIVGVALAVILGGPGAVFWMWVVAIVGMATAFVEATLAQVFKRRGGGEGTFIGGPAYYILHGLGRRTWAIAFACILLFVFGFSYEATQANTIAGVFEGTFGVPPWVTGLFLVVMATPVFLGGIKSIARITEWMAPLMAAVYVFAVLVILALNVTAIPGVLVEIVDSAFGLRAGLAGTAGGVAAALLNGVRRGLYSNEAGMGSAPNSAATATVAHPVQQGFIQSLGVFFDTLVICTATALTVLISGVYQVGTPMDTALASTLTQSSMVAQFGSWVQIPFALIIFVFAFSTLIGNFAYADVNADFLHDNGKRNWWLVPISVAGIFLGSIADLALVWTVSDIAQGIMAIINIVAIALLGRWAFGALRDYENQIRLQRAGAQDFIHFSGRNNPFLPADVPTDVWTTEPGVVPRAEVPRKRLTEYEVPGTSR